jgi:2-C-methyl-D-erythritol 4-phosphate cytidylyltransferase
MKVTAVIVAAGKGERLPGAVPKQYRPIAGKQVLAHTLLKFDACPEIEAVVLVVAEEYMLYATDAVVDRHGIRKVGRVVPGGDSRFASVHAGLKKVSRDTDVVVIHDGVRPLVSLSLISRGVRLCQSEGAVVATTPAYDAIKRVEDEYVLASLDTARLYHVQTPQFFWYDVIMTAYNQAVQAGLVYGDDSGVVEAAGYKVRIVAGEENNIKITTSRDLDLFRFLLSSGEQDDVRA